MRIEELLNEHYNRLTENDAEILKYISRNRKTAAELTSEELAKECHVSRTTLLRFCQKLELKSFAELKYLLKSQEDEKEAESGTDMEVICQSYHHIIDELKRYDYREVCRLIQKAETIYIYGTGNAQKAEADTFKLMFLSIGKCVMDLYDLGEIRLMENRFSEKDLFIVISLSGETGAGIEILKSVKSTNIHTLSITRFDNNSIARICDHNLYVETRMTHGYQNLNYEITAPFYVLLDILYVNYLDYIREDVHED